MQCLSADSSVKKIIYAVNKIPYPLSHSIFHAPAWDVLVVFPLTDKLIKHVSGNQIWTCLVTEFLWKHCGSTAQDWHGWKYLCFLKLWKALSLGKFFRLSVSAWKGTPPRGENNALDERWKGRIIVKWSLITPNQASKQQLFINARNRTYPILGPTKFWTTKLNTT